MARVSPDTVAIDNLFIPFNHFGGYYYPDEYIRVFSHTHMVGAGALDLGTVGVMPTNKFPTPLTIQSYNYRSKFSHTNETASAGYYKVSLIDSFITVELTATEHAAVHRYTFGDVASPRVILFPIRFVAQK
jgi:putative alpha-1,2-mannosidase